MNRAMPAVLCALCATLTPAMTTARSTPDRLPQGAVSVELRAAPDSAMPPSVVLAIELDESLLGISGSRGAVRIEIPGGNVSGKAGQPALPGLTLRVALPDGMRAERVRVLSCAETTLEGDYRPAHVPLPRPMTALGSPPLEPPSVEPYDPADLRSFPLERARLTGQADLAGQSFAIIRVNPLRYVPASRELTLATSIELAIEGEPGHVCGDYLPNSATGSERERVLRKLRACVVNPDDVELRTGEATHRAVEPGDYDYVIITHSDLVDDFAPLVEWRTRKGIRTNVVTVGSIISRSEYRGTPLQKLRNFVADAHATWGATDFLLGADTHAIPYQVTTVTVPEYMTENIPHDTYFADYDDDYVLEVNIGRIPMRSSLEVATFIGKVLAYEKSPPAAGWATTVAYFGFDIAVPGDGHGEVCKEMIGSMHLPASWSLVTEYDSDPGAHKGDVIAHLNTGHHLVNHHDHCNSTSMGAGWISHGDLITNPDIASLTNGDRQSFCFAIGCYPCDFPTHTSIAEQFVKNALGGGFAFIGNSRTGWGGVVEDPCWYNVRQDRFFYRNLFDDGFVYLGENFSDAKNDEYDPDDPYNLHQFCFLQLHLIGDPAVPLWTEDPAILTVTHPETAYAGLENACRVSVDDGRGPVDGATVCLWKGDEVYEVAETVGGAATLRITPATAGTLLVTAWAPNHLPYEANVPVEEDYTGTDGEAEPAHLALEAFGPNPSAAGFEFVLAVPGGAGGVRVRVYNVRGQLVRTVADRVFEPGEHRLHWDGMNEHGEPISGGVYFCRAETGDESDSRKLIVLR
jgi:hypothetical protein